MAAYTKIIELFGLPACGKTTLMEYICKHSQNDLNIATKQQVVKEAKQHPLKLTWSLPCERMLSGLRLRLCTPLDKKRNNIRILGWPSHSRYYAYAKRYTTYDMVLCDHGDIQSIVSLERGENLHETNEFCEACFRYLNKSQATIYVYCKIDSKAALERMKGRKRITGRIDTIGDESLQLQELDKEKKRFDFFVEMLRNQNKQVFVLDMRESKESVGNNLMNHLNLM